MMKKNLDQSKIWLKFLKFSKQLKFLNFLTFSSFANEFVGIIGAGVGEGGPG